MLALARGLRLVIEMSLDCSNQVDCFLLLILSKLAKRHRFW